MQFSIVNIFPNMVECRYICRG